MLSDSFFCVSGFSGDADCAMEDESFVSMLEADFSVEEDDAGAVFAFAWTFAGAGGGFEVFLRAFLAASVSETVFKRGLMWFMHMSDFGKESQSVRYNLYAILLFCNTTSLIHPAA